MSRCYPYPSPNYQGSEAMIESLKLQKEREKTRIDKRKEEKRVKKDKSRVEKGKVEEKKHSHKKRHHGELSQLNSKDGDHVKARKDETEQLEKSSLTEEQCPPAIQNSYDSSDSTQNSSKRKKHEPSDASRTSEGCSLRIRFSLSKPKDTQVNKEAERPLSNREGPPCSSQRMEEPCFSGRTETTSPQEPPPKAVQDKPSLFGVSIGGSSISCDCSMEKVFKKLILNWKPQPFQETESPDLDDQDWLFGARQLQHHEQSGRRGQISSEGLRDTTIVPSWPPRASFLPDAGIYALPYVVPF